MEKIIKIFHCFEDARSDEIAYYKSLSPFQRLEIIEELRKHYYDETSTRLPRVLEIITKT